ncbi:hypothetical protein INR49_000181 [Caranx melampygus]|nr:hypothetical protein INR49_000181 [Caranx melampygus]
MGGRQGCSETGGGPVVGTGEAPMHQPGLPQADPALLYPPALSPDPGSPLTHLGTLLAGHDAPMTGNEWDG